MEKRKLDIQWPADRGIETATLDRLWSEVYAATFAAETRSMTNYPVARERAVGQADQAVAQLVANVYG